jgi:hypothetical protein
MLQHNLHRPQLYGAISGTLLPRRELEHRAGGSGQHKIIKAVKIQRILRQHEDVNQLPAGAENIREDV